MTLKAFPNGFGGVTGSILATGSPSYVFGKSVRYVDSVTGDNDNNGNERKAPYATLAFAITNSASGDIIICLATHTETLASQQVVNKELTIVGEGSSGGIPTVTFNSSMIATDMFSLTSDNTSFHNIKFPVPTVSTTGYKMEITTGLNGTVFDGCYFELNDLDTVGAMEIISIVSPGDLNIQNTTFVSTSTSTTGTSRPGHAMDFTAAGGSAVNYGGLTMDGVTFDGGVSGFRDGRALNSGSANIAIENMKITQLSILNGADIFLDSLSEGYIVDVIATGSSTIDPTG